MKKIRGDKLSGVVIHAYMELSQGNSLCSYLYLKLKCHVFILSFLFFFLLQNWRTRRVQQAPPRGRLAPVGGGGVGQRV
jgi:hypothetical protein